MAKLQNAFTMKEQAGTKLDQGRAITGVMDRYYRLLENAPASQLEGLLFYVNWMASKNEPLFVLLTSGKIEG